MLGVSPLPGTKQDQEYQRLLISADPPCLPYLQWHLLQLEQVEEEPDTYPTSTSTAGGGGGTTDAGTEEGEGEKEPVINFEKRRRAAYVIRELQQYQQTPYNLQYVPLIHELLSHYAGQAWDEATLMEASKKLEP